MGCGVVLAQVGFDFDYTRGQAEISLIAYEYFTQEFASDAARIASEERATERVDGSDWGGRGQILKCDHGLKRRSSTVLSAQGLSSDIL
ncbi:MAG: hypothetical protein WBV69_03175 [Candidatus Sulfotelmatobacter sp.]